MAGITVVPTYRYLAQTYQGVPIRSATLVISGLTAGAANSIPHGLPATPVSITYNPGANGLWGETHPPDSTNVYITVGAGGATSGTALVHY